MHQNKLGQEGEQLIADKLQKDGFAIVARNYTIRYGEIDIIAQKDNLLTFVEVKTRRNPFFDTAQIITRKKQKNMITVAKQYLAAHTITDKYCRFDVALVEYKNNIMELTYIPDAFTECE